MLNDRTDAASNDCQAGAPTPLVDSFGRVHTSLRLSVTDRCNLRCQYCMPAEGAEFVPRAQLLTFEEMTRLVQLMNRRMGVNDVRITGGEPTVRRDLEKLIAQLSAIEGLEDLSLTTNGIGFERVAKAYRDAGLRRVNLSIDTLDRNRFQKITRRDQLDATLAGIRSAVETGFDLVKLNALAIRGVTEHDVIDLVGFAAKHQIEIRFIEFMPLDADRSWHPDAPLRGDELLEQLRDHFGSLTPLGRVHESQPAESFQIGSAKVGIIRSVSQPFCQACNRLRMTAEGSIRNCLFAQDETPLRSSLRDGATDDQLEALIRDSIAKKRAGHGIDQEGFQPPQRPMYSIGG